MKIKEHVGWTIVRTTKNKKIGYIEQASMNEKYEVAGVSGFGKIYYSKNRAQKDADALNDIWTRPGTNNVFRPFIVKKAVLKVID
jgi:hypothetical protein